MASDLSVVYLGLHLRTPFVPSSSPRTELVSNVKRMEDAGAAAVVFHSLFEEQLRPEKPKDASLFKITPDAYLNKIARARESVNIPLIASLNACTPGTWTKYARDLQQAGAHAIELNIYRVPTDPTITSEAIERDYVEIFRSVKSRVRIPVAVKLSPYFTNLARLVGKLDEAGADGIVLFNRFYQPDIDLETLDVTPNILLSSSADLRLPLRWTAILYGRLAASLAATSGIHRATDAIKLILAGADVTMVCSVLMRRGITYLEVLEKEMREWMDAHHYASLADIQGCLSQLNCAEPSAFERAHYVRAVTTREDPEAPPVILQRPLPLTVPGS